MEKTTAEQLRLFADKLNVMWGASPDANLLRKAADELENPPVVVPATPKKGKSNA